MWSSSRSIVLGCIVAVFAGLLLAGDPVSPLPTGSKVRHFIGGEASRYELELENDTIYISDLDKNRGVILLRRPHVASRSDDQLNIRNNKDGSVAEYTVVLGDVRYYDINGDGFIDWMEDRRPRVRRVWILFEGTFVEVRAGRHGPVGDDYQFVAGRWVSKSPRKKLPKPSP